MNKGLSRLLLYNAGAVLVILLSMEIGSRTYYAFRGIPFFESSTENLSTIYTQSHPYLPAALKKNTELKRQEGIFINNVGFRGPDIVQPKSAGSIRIAVLGGSAVWGSSGPDHETWPRVLEEELKENFPKRLIEVINAGVPGYNSMESLINLITKVIPLDPDVIVVYQAYNDMKAISKASSFETDYSDWRSRQSPHDAFYPKLQDKSRFVYGFDRLIKRVGKKTSKGHFNSGILFQDKGQIKIYKNNLFKIIKLCHAHEIIPVMSTFNLGLDSEYINLPSSLQLKSGEYAKAVKAYNEVIYELAYSLNVDYIDIEKNLPDTEIIHSDIVHFTKYGKEEMGRLFAEKIKVIIEERQL